MGVADRAELISFASYCRCLPFAIVEDALRCGLAPIIVDGGQVREHVAPLLPTSSKPRATSQL
jgi:hypothetical protein